MFAVSTCMELVIIIASTNYHRPMQTLVAIKTKNIDKQMGGNGAFSIIRMGHTEMSDIMMRDSGATA